MRHGESFANVNNIISEDMNQYPLTERGVEQILFSAEQLKGLRFDGIVCSPLLRTKQTAKTVGEVVGLKVTEDNKIRESGLGPYNGYRVDEVPKLKREDLGMETWDSQLERMRSAISEYNGSYILVSHALPIRVLTASFLGLNERESYGIDIKLASMTAIDVEHERVVSIGTVLLTERIRKLFSS
ncbi:MAG: histidine phosphatase family protein [Thermoplasmatales archaeon]|jgi:probable phosphoglycerate mutase|nr:histidine phosphatase family protein [Candidatus Thermoplasmatota archaeon]MDA8054994.1 histidine phosphatase family protein [Thermoplasmatales archaeon]